MGDSVVTVGGALKLYDRWRHDPQVELAPEPQGMETNFRQALSLFAEQAATKAVADCYLLGFAATAGARIVTFDKGLAETARRREVPVTLLRATISDIT